MHNMRIRDKTTKRKTIVSTTDFFLNVISPVTWDRRRLLVPKTQSNKKQKSTTGTLHTFHSRHWAVTD